MMRQFFMTVPAEMEEAATIDGAGIIRTFFSIMLPMAKSTLASLAIIVFTFAWNDYFTTFIMINSTEKLTLPVEFYQSNNRFPQVIIVVFAAVCLAVLPVLFRIYSGTEMDCTEHDAWGSEGIRGGVFKEMNREMLHSKTDLFKTGGEISYNGGCRSC